jgi:hypothetical protein
VDLSVSPNTAQGWSVLEEDWFTFEVVTTAREGRDFVLADDSGEYPSNYPKGSVGVTPHTSSWTG